MQTPWSKGELEKKRMVADLMDILYTVDQATLPVSFACNLRKLYRYMGDMQNCMQEINELKIKVKSLESLLTVNEEIKQTVGDIAKSAKLRHCVSNIVYQHHQTDTRVSLKLECGSEFIIKLFPNNSSLSSDELFGKNLMMNSLPHSTSDELFGKSYDEFAAAF